jgi:hypothetical protein
MTVDLFNISTKTWQNFPSYRVPNLQHIACTLVGNDSILVSGGQTLNETLGGFWSWNVTTKAWKELPSLIVPRHSHGEKLSKALGQIMSLFKPYLTTQNCLSHVKTTCLHFHFRHFDISLLEI